MRVDDPLTYASRRENAGDRLSALCPLKNVSLEKVRLTGRLYHMLEGAFRHLTHLSLCTVGSLQLRDLCQVLMEHGQSLLNLTLIGNQIIEPDSRDTDGDAGWHGRGEAWSPGGRAPSSIFDRALGHCVNLNHLSIEPGTLPVYQPSTLFRPLGRLETLQFNKKDASGYDFMVWYVANVADAQAELMADHLMFYRRSALGLMPTLSEQRRRLKSESSHFTELRWSIPEQSAVHSSEIKFGHDWPSTARQVASLNEVWSRYAEVVELGKLPGN